MSDVEEAVKRLERACRMDEDIYEEHSHIPTADLRTVLDALAAAIDRARDREYAMAQWGRVAEALADVTRELNEAKRSWSAWMLTASIWHRRASRWRAQCRRRREQVRCLTEERDELDELAGERYRSRKALHAELRAEKAAHEKTKAAWEGLADGYREQGQAYREAVARAEAAERERDEVNEQLLRAQLEAVQGVEVSPEEFEKLKEAFSKDAKPNAALRAAFLAATGNHKP
jgi:chromosome segregation ATPase